MNDLTIKNLYRDTKTFENSIITLDAWVKTVRDSKTFGFMELNDGTFFKNVQVVFTDSLSNFVELCKLPISSSIRVTGKLVITENAKQPFEIQAQEVVILSKSDADYPLQKKDILLSI